MSKAAIPIANIYYLLCYAWGHADQRDSVHVGTLGEFNRVQDLLAKVLVEGTFRLMRQGMDRDYRERHEDLAGIRGKIVVGETVKRALRARGQVACEYEELSVDVLHNRILRSTLRSLLQLKDMDRDVRTEVRGAYANLDGVRLVPLSRRVFSQVRLDGNRRHYRFLMSVCRLVYEQLLVDERTGAATFVDFGEERMWKLYEDFIIQFYRREQQVFRVNGEGRGIRWVDDGTPEHQRGRIPSMEADVVLEAPHRRVILDAKFYGEALGERYGNRRLHSANVYQLLAYLRNREATASPGPKHEGILLYPTVDEAVTVDVRLEGFWIRARSIDLAQDWRDIHRDMLNLVA